MLASLELARAHIRALEHDAQAVRVHRDRPAMSRMRALVARRAR